MVVLVSNGIQRSRTCEGSNDRNVSNSHCYRHNLWSIKNIPLLSAFRPFYINGKGCRVLSYFALVLCHKMKQSPIKVGQWEGGRVGVKVTRWGCGWGYALWSSSLWPFVLTIPAEWLSSSCWLGVGVWGWLLSSLLRGERTFGRELLMKEVYDLFERKISWFY